MLAFKCPACQTTINLPDSARGERVVCGHCGESVFVAASTEPREPEVQWPSLDDREPRRAAFPRKKQPSVLNLLPLIAISAVTCYMAWRMYDATVNRPPVPEKRSIVIKPPRTTPQPRPQNPTPIPKLAEKLAPTAAKEQPEPPPVPVAPKQPAFADFPSFVALPQPDYTEMAIIAKPSGNCEIEVLSNSADLTQDGAKLRWKNQLVAGLRVEEGELQFRWIKDVPPEAEAAICNSVVRLRVASDERFLALREPSIGEPLLLDLKDSTHRVNAKCNWLPPTEEIRFGLTLPDQLPIKKIDGPDVASLKARDETIIIYSFDGDAATKVSVKKAGDAIAATFASQYVLPSGDVEPLSISRGNRRMNQLTDLQADADNARRALPDLRSHHSRMESSLRTVMNASTGQRLSGGGYIDNPVATGQRNMAAAQLQNEIALTERNIARASNLIDRKPSIDADIAALRSVSALARSIDKAPLAYRFFIVVGGHEVDLIHWDPAAHAGNAIPAVLAQPVR